MKKFLSVLLVVLFLVFPMKICAAEPSDIVSGITPFYDINGSARSSTPMGYLDSVGPHGVSGWAWVPNSPETALNIHIYVTDQYGSFTIFTTVANLFRQDLYNAGYGTGRYAFVCDIDWRNFLPGTYTIVAYAIGGGNPALTNSPMYYDVQECCGTVDGLTSGGMSGWAWKPNEPNLPIDVHFYIRRANDEVLDFRVITASDYRADLYNAGYGNGNHAFGIPIDWSLYPEEQLYLYLYGVDGSGSNPLFWSGIYDNRMPINLLGMEDSKGVKFYSAFDSDMISWCQNIGCTTVNTYSGANVAGITDIVKNASYAVIYTHGSYNNLSYWLNNSSGTMTLTDINSLPDGHFDATRCLLIMACEVGYGGAGYNNVVNAFHNRGVDTVVGFQTKTWFVYVKNEGGANHGGLYTDRGSACWVKAFTKKLSEGYTIDSAIYYAYNQSIIIPGEGVDDDGNVVPFDYGLSSVYVAGNANQIVKH